MVIFESVAFLGSSGHTSSHLVDSSSKPSKLTMAGSKKTEKDLVYCWFTRVASPSDIRAP